MYKHKSSKNRRYTKTSGDKYARNSNSGNRGYRGGRSGGYRQKNRKRFSQTIHHSKYVSKGVSSSSIPEYINENTFSDFRLHPAVNANIDRIGYINPTKIQDQAIPRIMEGRDILGISRTGSGKTGAFLLPMIDKALRDRQCRVLIVTPTRELASQINNEFRKFTHGTKSRMVLVIGGANIREQIKHLRNGPQFIVATPGRLMDLEDRNVIDLSQFSNVVLDEVDQMLDMGFVNDIKKIVSKLGRDRQSLFFSATMSPKEEAIANELLLNPIKVEADKQNPVKNVHQDIVKVTSRSHKMDVLHKLLRKKEFNKVLVFSRTKREADKIAKELRIRGVRSDSLHGDKSQNKRSRVLSTFRQDKLDVLVATDVAARGIDIPDISHVINYDEPATYNDYIHRIGRTGRIGKKGTALTFVVSKDAQKVPSAHSTHPSHSAQGF